MSVRRTTRWRDLTGVKFGRLTVLGERGQVGYMTFWNCRCVCGRDTVARTTQLTGGNKQSCGCLQREAAAAAQWKHGASRRGRKEPLYGVWSAMKERCSNPNQAYYDLYGARGITVCDRWRDSFEAFRDDMGPPPSPRHTIERIDNDRGYEPGNVRWATVIEQARNRRMTKLTVEDARQIRCLRAIGVERPWVAALFGVAPATITGITCGRSWIA